MPYHDHTLALLELAAEPASDKHVARVSEAEAHLGVRLPPSVREWYLREDALELMSSHSNQDPPIPPEQFAAISWRTRTLLPIRHENQGVCTWALLLDGSDDPPVYVDVDTAGLKWTVHARSFSEYIYAGIWDYRRVLERPALVMAQNAALSPECLAELRRMGTPMVQTSGWPGSHQYRIALSRADVLIWADTLQADWSIGADDPTALSDVLSRLWEMDRLGEQLYAGTPAGEAALRLVKTGGLRAN